MTAGTGCSGGGPTAYHTPTRGYRGRRQRTGPIFADAAGPGRPKGLGRVGLCPPPVRGRSSAPRRPRRAGQWGQGLRPLGTAAALAALQGGRPERGRATGAVASTPGPRPSRRGRCGSPVPARCCLSRSCAGGDRCALCRRSLRRSPQRRAGAPRPALGRRPRCERESGTAGRSMDGTVSLAPGPAAPGFRPARARGGT